MSRCGKVTELDAAAGGHACPADRLARCKCYAASAATLPVTGGRTAAATSGSTPPLRTQRAPCVKGNPPESPSPPTSMVCASMLQSKLYMCLRCLRTNAATATDHTIATFSACADNVWASEKLHWAVCLIM